jgi:hypothetical protein
MSDSLPTVSVLVLSYNHRAYIAEALESITSQVVPFDIEILVGDDCSTDGTWDVILAYADRFPGLMRPHRHPQNVGMHANHAYLIEKARGRYIAYCEGDDFWLGRDKLSRQVEFMEKNPDYGLIHGNYLNVIQIDGHWKVRPAFRRKAQFENRSDWIYGPMLQANRIQTCTVLCKAELLREYRRLGPGVDAYGFADWPQTLYASHQQKVAFIRTPIAAYRRTPGSVMNSGAAAAVTLGLDAIRMVHDFTGYFSDSDVVRHAALLAQHEALLSLAFFAGDKPHFEMAQGWLRLHGRSRIAVRASIMHLLIGMPRVRLAVVRTLRIVESIKHRLEFRIRREAQ